VPCFIDSPIGWIDGKISTFYLVASGAISICPSGG